MGIYYCRATSDLMGQDIIIKSSKDTYRIVGGRDELPIAYIAVNIARGRFLESSTVIEWNEIQSIEGIDRDEWHRKKIAVREKVSPNALIQVEDGFSLKEKVITENLGIFEE